MVFFCPTELEGWTFGDLVEYFEDEERLLGQHNTTVDVAKSPRKSKRRKASAQFVEKTQHRVLNQITFEFTRTPLSDVVQSPTFVREMDWIDTVWPRLWRHERSIYPAVQLYCLTSAAGSYTDFHVDFGGTSVWYHLVSGLKTFLLIEPTNEHLQVYESWLTRKDQANTFLVDLLPSSSVVLKLTLRPQQTLFIPSGWIHAVYTPIDALVFGGNFLHGLDIPMQLSIHKLEDRTKVPDRFRFPYYAATHIFAASHYLDRVRCRKGNKSSPLSVEELESLSVLADALEEFGSSEMQDKKVLSVSNGLPTLAEALLSVSPNHGTCCESVSALADALRKASYHALHDPSYSGTTMTTRNVADKVKKKCLDGCSTTTSDSPESPLRIRLTVASQQSTPLPFPKRREDLASFVDATDDDWVPTRRSPGNTKYKQASEAKKRTPTRTTNKTTARDRLLKKMKRR